VVLAVAALAGRSVAVSWLDARLLSPGERSVQTRSVSGGTVLLVASGVGTAVVSGDAPLTSLWEVAARIQTSHTGAASGVTT
jgi:hypothetical protein